MGTKCLLLYLIHYLFVMRRRVRRSDSGKIEAEKEGVERRKKKEKKEGKGKKKGRRGKGGKEEKGGEGKGKVR